VSLTPQGAALTAAAMRPLLDAGELEVSDGQQTARAAITSAEVVDGELRLSATFAEGDANFEWSQRAVITPDGTRFDVEPEDLGRKARGTAWDLTVALSWAKA
jgi:hypothetical protein